MRISDINRYWLVAAAIVVLGVIVWVFAGCTFGQRMHDAGQAFVAENPGAAVIPVDEDGDDTIDFLGADTDADGKVDRDSAGELIVVPGSARPAAQAKEADAGISELITLAGAVIGIPGIGLVGSWWGKRKPIAKFNDLVYKFQEARVTDSPEGMISFSLDVLHTIKDEQPELYAAIRAARKDFNNKKESNK